MSDDQDALEHLRGWLALITERRDQEALEEASMIKRQAAAAGRLASGNTLHSLIRHAGDDLRIRSELYRRALDDTWQSYRPGVGFLETAQAMLADLLAAAADARIKAVQGSASSLGLSMLPPTVWDGLREEADYAKQRQVLQLREWAMNKKHTDQPASLAQTTTINLSGNNNNVVAGLMNSSANVRLDEGSQAQVIAALAAVRSAITETRVLPEADANETVELIQDAEAELARDQPNKRKLRASLEGVASTIQTVGALGDAYKVLKTAMALIGIPLP